MTGYNHDAHKRSVELLSIIINGLRKPYGIEITFITMDNFLNTNYYFCSFKLFHAQLNRVDLFINQSSYAFINLRPFVNSFVPISIYSYIRV